MRRGVSVRAYEAAEEETANGGGGEACVVSPKKWGGRREKKGCFVRKSTSFYLISPYVQKNETFFSQKIRPFETKLLLLRLIKHNFPFIPPPCGVHIAQSRGTFPDRPAQMLFDLLNSSRLCLIPAYRNRLQRRCPSQSGDICTTATRPLGLVRIGVCRERRRSKGLFFLPQEKEHAPSLDSALWATPFVSCPAPGRQIRPSLFDFRGACFLKKKARSPIQKGFGWIFLPF